MGVAKAVRWQTDNFAGKVGNVDGFQTSIR